MPTARFSQCQPFQLHAQDAINGKEKRANSATLSCPEFTFSVDKISQQHRKPCLPVALLRLAIYQRYFFFVYGKFVERERKKNQRTEEECNWNFQLLLLGDEEEDQKKQQNVNLRLRKRAEKTAPLRTKTKPKSGECFREWNMYLIWFATRYRFTYSALEHTINSWCCIACHDRTNRETTLLINKIRIVEQSACISMTMHPARKRCTAWCFHLNIAIYSSLHCFSLIIIISDGNVSHAHALAPFNWCLIIVLIFRFCDAISCISNV